MVHAAAARLLSTEDVVLEILHRVSTDRAALFRCAAACKRWRTLVADRSFLRRCWPDESAGGPSTLLGFLNQQHVVIDGKPSFRLFFVPQSEGFVIVARRRLLTSLVDGLLDDDSHRVQAQAARHGLVLVHLFNNDSGHYTSVHMAVCDMFARTCRVLPPLKCTFSFISCTILTGAECGQHHRSVNYFKVLVVVLSKNPRSNDEECNLYTFSSTDSRWSAPTKCFDDIYQEGKRGFHFPDIRNGNGVVCGTTAPWLVPYSSGRFGVITKYYTLDVSSDTGHTSLTELPIAASQTKTTYFNSRSTLGVTADGSLSLFYMNVEDRKRRINMWKRGSDEIWLHSMVIELDLPRQTKDLSGIRMLSVEKSDTLLVIDESECVHKINVETGVVEEQQFQNALNILAMPMNMDWPTWFASRLG